MNRTEWLKYYRHVKLNDRRKSELIGRTGGLNQGEDEEQALTRLRSEMDALPDEQDVKIRKVVREVLEEKESARGVR
jgi:hypothetical protein